MYQPYPGGDQPPQQSAAGQSAAPVPLPIPQSVARAVQVMYVGALASLVGIVVELLARHSLRSYIADHATRNGKRLTATQVTDTVPRGACGARRRRADRHRAVDLDGADEQARAGTGPGSPRRCSSPSTRSARSAAWPAARCPAGTRTGSTGSSSGSSAWSRSSCSGSARRPSTSRAHRATEEAAPGCRPGSDRAGHPRFRPGRVRAQRRPLSAAPPQTTTRVGTMVTTTRASPGPSCSLRSAPPYLAPTLSANS